MPTCPQCGAHRPDSETGPCKLSPDGTAFIHGPAATVVVPVITWTAAAADLEAEEQPTLIDASYKAYGQPVELSREEDAEAEPEAIKPAPKKSKGKR